MGFDDVNQNTIARLYALHELEIKKAVRSSLRKLAREEPYFPDTSSNKPVAYGNGAGVPQTAQVVDPIYAWFAPIASDERTHSKGARDFVIGTLGLRESDVIAYDEYHASEKSLKRFLG